MCETQVVPTGWRCPVCGSGISPRVDRCPCSKARNVAQVREVVVTELTTETLRRAMEELVCWDVGHGDRKSTKALLREWYGPGEVDE